MSNTFVDSVRTKAQEVTKEDFEKVKVICKEAARSGSLFYPLKGIVYFATHRALWRPFLSRLLPVAALTVGVVSAMFFFTYVPQLTILIFLNGPLAVFSTVLLVLNESSTIITFISKNFLLQDAITDTFDGTLVAKNATHIVREGRQVQSGGDPIQRLGKIFKSSFNGFSANAFVRYIMYLPMNFIPVVGTVMFILLQGRARGGLVHIRYFELKGWSPSQSADWVREHSGAYSGFGTIATLLEMVPFASSFFAFTNTVGAALWAADIEDKASKLTPSTAPGLREAAKKAE